MAENMTLTDRIRVWLWLDIWTPAYSAWRNWRAWRRATEDERKRTEDALTAWENEMITSEIPALHTDPSRSAKWILDTNLRYESDADGDYAQSPRTIALSAVARQEDPVPCDCEDYATLGGWLFGRVGIRGHIVTMIRRGKRSWRTLWFEPWEAHAVWWARDYSYMVDNATVIQGEEATTDQMLSWIGRGFEPVHWSPTK